MDQRVELYTEIDQSLVLHGKTRNPIRQVVPKKLDWGGVGCMYSVSDMAALIFHKWASLFSCWVEHARSEKQSTAYS